MIKQKREAKQNAKTFRLKSVRKNLYKNRDWNHKNKQDENITMESMEMPRTPTILKFKG